MKKVVLLITLITLVFSCKSEPQLPPDTYQINVSAKGVYNGMRAYIVNLDEKRREINIDTAIVINEVFSFSGSLKTPAMRAISVNGAQKRLPFIFEPGITNIELNYKNIDSSIITGSKNNEEFQKYLIKSNALSKEFGLIKQKIRTANSENDSELKKTLNIDYRKQIEVMSSYPHDYINEHPKSIFSLLLLESLLLNRNHDISKFKENLANLNTVINKNEDNKFIGTKINSFIRSKEATATLDIGKITPDFSAPSPEGNIIKLSDIKGKVTLIDFWASWCKPCRIENPNVVKVYEKYHEKGLEIISVSLDKPGKKDAWLKAIKDDNLQWHHVSNLQYWNEPIAHKYQVRSIPATFLIDADGKIIAKKLRGAALENKIAELLD